MHIMHYTLRINQTERYTLEYYIKERELKSAYGKIESYEKLKELCDWLVKRVSSDNDCLGLSRQAEDYLLDCDCYFVGGNCVEIEGATDLIESTIEKC